MLSSIFGNSLLFETILLTEALDSLTVFACLSADLSASSKICFVGHRKFFCSSLSPLASLVLAFKILIWSCLDANSIIVSVFFQ